MVEAPSLYFHTERPEADSTAARPWPDCKTTRFGPPAFLISEGEVQFASFGRSNFQRFSPVRTSRPAAKDSLSFSTCAMTTPSAVTSEDDIPSELLAFG